MDIIYVVTVSLIWGCAFGMIIAFKIAASIDKILDRIERLEKRSKEG